MTPESARWKVVEKVWECGWHCPGCPKLRRLDARSSECTVLEYSSDPADCPQYEEPPETEDATA